MFVVVYGLKLESRNSGGMTHSSPLASQGKAHASGCASLLCLDKPQGKPGTIVNIYINKMEKNLKCMIR